VVPAAAAGRLGGLMLVVEEGEGEEEEEEEVVVVVEEPLLVVVVVLVVGGILLMLGKIGSMALCVWSSLGFRDSSFAVAPPSCGLFPFSSPPRIVKSALPRSPCSNEMIR